MIRRLLLLCALATFVCGNAYGVGLGKLELNSALNQEFDAEIELTNIRGLTPDEILPGLASQEDFERVGVERGYQLTDLRFNVVEESDGTLIIKVSSTRPVVEPFLNFIVEVLWPNGRILREYTVLLDPPVFGEQGVEPLQPAQTQARQTAPQPEAEPEPEEPVAQQQPTERRPRLEQGSMTGQEYGMTGPGDTLWAIAMQVRPGDVSIQQTMLAIQRENPEAFISNNINLLKAGHVLRIPSAAEMRQDSRQAAIAEVQTQNDEFEAYRSGQVAQLDATGRRPSQSRDTGGQTDDGELRIVSSDTTTGERAGDTGGSARAQQLEDELAVAQEDLDRARRANSELNSRLADLEEQVQTTNEMVQMKDDQLAALRAEVQRLQQAEQQQAPQDPTTSVSTPQPAGGLLANPYVLIGLGVVIFGGALAGLFFMRRRQQSGFADDDFDTFAVDDEDSADTPEMDDSMQVAEEAQDESEAQSDPIAEAEIYIAYGRFPQAITFLQNAIESEPNRADIQLKLLEVYVQTEDATAFNLQFEQLKTLGDEDANAKAAELQQKIPGAAENAEAAMDATVVSTEPVEAVADTGGDDDDDLSFDLDDLDAETEEDTLDLSDDVSLDDDSEEMDLDIDLDGDDDTAKAEASADSDDEELSLDEDFDLDLAADSTEDAGSDDDDGIELNLDDDDDGDLDLDLESAASDSSGDDELNLDDDDGIELNLDDDEEIDLDFGDDTTSDDSSDDDDGIELDLGDDDDFDFNLEEDSSGADDDDDGIELDLGDDDDDGLELNLDEDASTKLDLARAYIDMGDKDGAKNVLEEVIKEGSETEVAEANELLEKI